MTQSQRSPVCLSLEQLPCGNIIPLLPSQNIHNFHIPTIAFLLLYVSTSLCSTTVLEFRYFYIILPLHFYILHITYIISLHIVFKWEHLQQQNFPPGIIKVFWFWLTLHTAKLSFIVKSSFIRASQQTAWSRQRGRRFDVRKSLCLCQHYTSLQGCWH